MFGSKTILTSKLLMLYFNAEDSVCYFVVKNPFMFVTEGIFKTSNISYFYNRNIKSIYCLFPNFSVLLVNI